MKKIIIFFLFFYVYATDFSADTTTSTKTNVEKTKNKNSSLEQGNRLVKSIATTKQKRKLKSNDYSVSEVAQADILDKIEELENKNIYPFSTCKILTKPKLLADFGITAETPGGGIDTIKADLMSSAAKYNFLIEKIGADENKIKDYINCEAYYAAIIAQSFITNKLEIKLKNRKIKRIYKKIKKYLARTKCRFKSELDTIICGPVKVQIGYAPVLYFSNIAIFNDDTFFGYTAKNDKTVSVSNSLEQSISKNKEKSVSSSKSISVSIASKLDNSLEQSSKSSFSPRNWIKFE